MDKLNKYQEFCNYLKEEYINKLSGESKDDEYIIGERPSDRIVIGLLDSGDLGDESKRFESMHLLKVNFFLNKSAKGVLHINIKGNLFYNVLPNYNDQINNIRIENNNDEKEEKIAKIVNKFKRIKIDNELKDIQVNVEKLIEEKRVDLSKEVNSRINKIRMDDSIYYKNRAIPVEKLSNENIFYDFIEKEKIIRQRPNWKFEVYLTCKKSNSKSDNYIVTLIFINKTPKCQNYNPKKEEFLFYPTPIFNVGVEIIGENVKFESNKLPYFNNSYKVDSNTRVKGEWISAEFNEKENKIYTTNVPKFIEYRRKTIDIYSENTVFENLINNPIENLLIIYEGMKKYVKDIKKDRATIESKDYEEFDKDINTFEQEINRFKIGIDVLNDYLEARKAFEYMNKTFSQNRKYTSWRLFQLVYIVSMIPDIIYNEHKDELKQIYGYKYEDETEILFFPTGGGKTEAFLGCATFTMFYDRLMGKNFGVSTIIKYPLRLLSIQQLDRCLKVIINANKVMDSTEEIKDKERFSLGYFVGSSNTPNKIEEFEKDEIVKKDDFKLIDICPECGGNIQLKYDEESKTLQHFCEHCNRPLPLYIVDDEIYRFLPTILISIVDKLTQISFSSSFKNILGAPGYRCKKHGFSHNKKCKYDINCEMEDISSSCKVSLAPTLFIQDELHLLKESLGAFSAHYESFCKYYINNLLPVEHSRKIKYIGATATISGADKLIKNLYGENCRIFPCNLTNKEGGNFYSYIDKKDISRTIIGFAPYGRSVNAGMEYSVTTLRKLLYNMYMNSNEYMKEIPDLQVDEDEFKAMVFYYWTTIVYFNSKNDNNKLRNTFDQQANIEHLGDIPDAKFNIIKMTGDEDFTEIKDSLNDIQREKNKMKTHNLILATSTISHGVDEDEFNNIFFYGVPSNTAQYIQAYSRVGRKYEGLVIDIIRLARARDTSYLNFFNLFHKYKDYLIYDVPINSTSVNAMKHTLPGIFIGLLKQYYSVRDNKDYCKIGNFINGIKNGKLSIEEIRDRLTYIYNTNMFSSDELKMEYERAIEIELINIIGNINNKLNMIKRDTVITNYMDEFTTIGTKVMTSLRDVDETVNITISFYGGNYEKK